MFEFINSLQENMNIKEYALRCIQLSEYASVIVSNSRARMSKFILGVPDLVVEECRTTILVNDMSISHLTTHGQNIKEDKLMERSRENKRSLTGGNFPYAGYDGHGYHMHRQRFLGQGSSNDQNFNKERLYNPKPKNYGSGALLSDYGKSGRKHMGECISCSDAFLVIVRLITS